MLFCRKIDVDKLAGMLQGTAIGEFAKDTLFEVSAIARKKGEHGEYAELTYATTIEGKRQAGKVRVPESALVLLQNDGPCLLFYGGPRQTAKGRTCHDISIMRVPDNTGAEQMKTMADRRRALGSIGIKAAMSGVSLDNFEINTMFVFSNPRLQSMGKERKEVLVVDFETGSNEQRASGKLLLPARLEDECKSAGSGILLYRGQRVSQDSAQ